MNAKSGLTSTLKKTLDLGIELKTHPLGGAHFDKEGDADHPRSVIVLL